MQPIGLGARDSLRLEAGLCLYGHDIDETTSPIEAGLAWSIQKRRREQGGFPGAARIQDELANGPKRRRVGIKPDGRAPAREGTEVLALLGDRIGVVTSGGFGPSVNGPVAMGYVQADHAEPGTPVNLMVRGKALPAHRPSCTATPVRPSVDTATHAKTEPRRGDHMATERFTKDHEWIRVDGGIATVGITDHAQSQLGDVVFVDVPEVGRKAAQGEAVAVVESVKAASDVFAPVVGRGDRGQRRPRRRSRRSSTRTPRARRGSSRSRSPSEAELDGLMDRAAYEAFVKEVS